MFSFEFIYLQKALFPPVLPRWTLHFLPLQFLQALAARHQVASYPLIAVSSYQDKEDGNVNIHLAAASNAG